MLSMSDPWKTSITKVEPDKLTVRGYPLDELIGNISFSDAIFLIIKGKMPSKEESALLDAILVSSIDHGVTPPSTLSARTVASTGATFNAALAAGVLSVNKHHGGAVEDCMIMLENAVADKRKINSSYQEIAEQLVRDLRKQKKKMPGFGHRIHKNDPRTKKLYEIAKQVGFYGEYVRFAESIQKAIKLETGKDLPINVDGAIASLLCELQFSASLANAFFIISRMPGLTAHVFEEISEQKPMRRINPDNYVYE